MSSFDSATLDFYAAEAPVYTASGPDGTNRYLQHFLNHLSKGASVLEIGCGGGRDAEAMIAQGFDVDATDGVPAMARQAEARIGKPIRVMQFHQLEAVAAYDAVWASASLLHVPRDGLTDILTRIWHALKPGGWHGATYKGGGAEGRDQMGRYYNYPTRSVLEEYYLAAGKWVTMATGQIDGGGRLGATHDIRAPKFEITEGIGGGYDGKQGPWLNIILQKAPES